jgi:hypothetical protein
MKKYQRKNSKKQKTHKMKSYTKKTRKNHLGGSFASNVANNNLAYPGTGITFLPNPALAYTGKGGKSNLACTDGITQSNLAYTGNTNGQNPAYPSSGPPAASQNWLGSQQNGGSCNCGLNYLIKGGSHHGRLCKCKLCKKNIKKGGNGLPYGEGLPEMKGAPYPNGLAGSPWKPPIANWPGVDGVSGDRNHLSYNTYSPNDVSRQMIATGANPPFSVGGGKKSKKGGNVSNFIVQDLVNLGRQIQFGIGSTYNALNGYASPVNPLPWKGQLANVRP